MKKIAYLFIIISLICQYFYSLPVAKAAPFSYEGKIQVLRTGSVPAANVTVINSRENMNSALKVSKEYDYLNCSSVFSGHGVNMVIQQGIFSLNQSAGCVAWSEGSRVVESQSKAEIKVVSEPANNFVSVKVLRESFEKAFPGMPLNSQPTAFFVSVFLFVNLLVGVNFLRQKESLRKRILVFKQVSFLTLQNMRC